MLNKELLIRKMKQIETYLGEVELPFTQKTVREILDDTILLAFVERRFQLIVDTMLDINTHIISAQDFTMPDDFQTTFETLGQHKVLPSEFAYKLAPVVGLRNRVVHKYEKLDPKQFLQELKENLLDFKEFLTHIRFYIDAQGKN